MPPKADKLKQTIDDLQLSVAGLASDRQELASISPELAELQQHLNRGKLTVPIVSNEPALARALGDLLHSHEQLKECFELKYVSVPKSVVFTTQQSAKLKLKPSRRDSSDKSQDLELSLEREQSIGRSPESDLAIDGKSYRGVSWYHATIKPLSENTWQICDRRSTNGTFVNGKRVTSCQTLQHRDVVTLASRKSGAGIAELIFTKTNSADTKENGNERDIIDADLLFIAIDGKRSLTLAEKELILNFDNTYIYQQFLIVNTPNEETENNLDTITNWLKSEAKDREWELVTLCLESDRQIDTKLSKPRERFIKRLEKLIKGQPENILAKRLAVKMVAAIAPIEPYLQEQQQELAQKIDKLSRDLEALSKENLKETSKGAIAQATQDKDLFFKQVKLDLAQSKAALLDIYSKRSLAYKIQVFIDNLTPVVSIKDGKKVIQLRDVSQPELEEIDRGLIYFCTNSLETWVTEEWQKICHVYDGGGLNSLIAKIERTVNIVPNLLAKSPFISPENFSVREKLAVSFAGANCETSYQQKSLGAYVMKQLRSQMMQIMMMLTLVLGFVGVSANKSQMMKNISGVFQRQPWIFGLFVCGIIFLLVNAYNNDNDLKLEEAGNKLKKDLANYYQSFSKNILDKVVKEIDLTLDLEDKKITQGLELVNSAYSDRAKKIERQQIQIENNLASYQARQKSLQDKLSQFEKLKRL